jgi:hypothetical protein
MMWLKILGVVCVGVFVGAAIVEARQLRKRGKETGEGEGDGEGEGEGEGEAVNPESDAELAHEER